MLYLNNREVSEHFADSNCIENFNVISHNLFFAICSLFKATPNLLLFTHFLEALYLYLLGNTSWNAGRKTYTYADVKNGVHCKFEKRNDPGRITCSVVGEKESSSELDDYINSQGKVMQAALNNVYAAYCKKRQAVAKDIPNLTVYYRVLMAEILNLLPIRSAQIPYEVNLMSGLILFCFYNSPLSYLSITETKKVWSDVNYSYIPLLPVNLNC